jgi:hypothetical protein
MIEVPGRVAVRSKIINLEEGMPTVTEALLRLERGLSLARQERAGLVKLIHGYGSTGVGGRLREEVQMELMRLARNGRIRGYIPGEEFRASNAESWALVQKHRPLRDDHDFNRGNRGITLVLL